MTPPAVAERDAVGETAALFADIRGAAAPPVRVPPVEGPLPAPVDLATLPPAVADAWRTGPGSSTWPTACSRPWITTGASAC